MKNQKRYCFALLLVFVIQFTACKQGKSKDIGAKEGDSSGATPSVGIDSLSYNLARLIGGKEVDIAYQQHLDMTQVRSFNQLTAGKVATIKENRLQKMSEWNRTNMVNNNANQSNFVFYPFSGGDLIHAHALYPTAQEYLLVAQEDVGAIPNLFSREPAFVNEYLNDVDTVLRDIYAKSYFITKNMIDDTKRKTLVNGMLPLILWAAVNSDYDVVRYSYLQMVDSTSELVPVPANDNGTKPDAVEITLRAQGANSIHKVTYVSCDISDDGFKRRASFMNYLQKKVPANCNAFVKSASYLMHYSTFSSIRNMLLTKAKYFVQDDSGIPYKYFDSKQWDLSLYGEYERPVKDFDISLFQSDLLKAYADSSQFKGGVNFSLGYHWGSQKQNLMVAAKK